MHTIGDAMTIRNDESAIAQPTNIFLAFQHKAVQATIGRHRPGTGCRKRTNVD